MRMILLLLAGVLALTNGDRDVSRGTGACASDTSLVHLARTEVAGSLAYEDLSHLGLPFRPSESGLVVVTDSAICSAGLAALNALGGEPEQSVLILDLAGSGWVIVGSALLDDTAHYFTREWQYLFTLHGGG